jgi:hypothetical protein
MLALPLPLANNPAFPSLLSTDRWLRRAISDTAWRFSSKLVFIGVFVIFGTLFPKWHLLYWIGFICDS